MTSQGRSSQPLSSSWGGEGGADAGGVEFGARNQQVGSEAVLQSRTGRLLQYKDELEIAVHCGFAMDDTSGSSKMCLCLCRVCTCVCVTVRRPWP